MNSSQKQIGREGTETDRDLAFFAKMCASMSHEIKNCMAVINEQNGLHQDLLMLQRQGRPLAFERVEKIAQTIADQIQRMDRIVKRLNRFAHSPDSARELIDLGDICAYTAQLCRRFAENRGLVLMSEGDAHIQVKGQFFVLLQFLVGCIESAFEQASSGDTIRLMVSMETGGPVIIIMPALARTSALVKSLVEKMRLTLANTEQGNATKIFFDHV